MVRFISEIGINHNGSVDLCKKMIMLSKVAGADYVKIQKEIQMFVFQNIKKINQKKHHEGDMTYLEYKHKIEFNEDQIKELCDYSHSLVFNFLLCMG